MRNNSINEHRESNKIISDYVKRKSDYLFIHYARQNCFSDAYEKGPRVVAIGAMNANSEQFVVFSLKKSADKQGKSFFELSDSEKDIIESSMLQDFFEYVENNKDKVWLHWNMKNNNFGFSAIEDRFRMLNGNPIHFEEGKLINISVLLKKKYGINYAKDNIWNGKTMGRMYDIFILNQITDSNILDGEREIIEYIVKNITSIEQSVLGKLKAFKIIMEKTADNVLKCRGNILKDVYGLNIMGIARYIQDNALLALLFSILGGIVATVICHWFGL